ncbi:unnamed protein product [Rotaria sp. Silwood1]|nr:unnamed protein product [Rotaria sp. Silwood1]CAF4839378.1 unnamed protein product [Rotaria sp. Silwood1]
MDIYAIPIDEIDKPINQVFPLIEERKLICYCDGSYSHYMQIGHFGFRASNGAHRIRFFSPRDPKTGSTDTEVLAACLAIHLPRENVIIPRLIVSNTSTEIKCDKSKSINEDYANSNRVQDEVPLTDSEHKETYFDDSNLGEQQ